MNTHLGKSMVDPLRSVANVVARSNKIDNAVFSMVDNRPQAVFQRKLQAMADQYSVPRQPLQKKGNSTALPDKAAGNSMEEEKCHCNEAKTTQLKATQNSAEGSVGLKKVDSPGGATIQRAKKLKKTIDALKKKRKELIKKNANSLHAKQLERLIEHFETLQKDKSGSMVNIRSSRVRHLRAWQRENKTSTKNIGVSKYKAGKGKARYVLAPSMGIGVPMMHLGGTDRHRSHSEAGMVAVKRSKALKVGKKKVTLPGKDIYHASSNEGCTNQPGQQDCSGQLWPELLKGGAKGHHVTPYSNSDDSAMFGQMVTAHDTAKKIVDGYDSDTASESEEDVYVLKTSAMEGVSFDSTSAIPAEDF